MVYNDNKKYIDKNKADTMGQKIMTPSLTGFRTVVCSPWNFKSKHKYTHIHPDKYTVIAQPSPPNKLFS